MRPEHSDGTTTSGYLSVRRASRKSMDSISPANRGPGPRSLSQNKSEKLLIPASLRFPPLIVDHLPPSIDHLPLGAPWLRSPRAPQGRSGAAPRCRLSDQRPVANPQVTSQITNDWKNTEINSSCKGVCKECALKQLYFVAI